MRKLTEEQRQKVTENHNLIYGFCVSNDLAVDDWYGILAFELCRAVQKLDKRKARLSTLFYLRAKNAVNNQYRYENAQKRTPESLVEYDDEMMDDGSDLEDTVHASKLKDRLLESEYADVIRLRLEGKSRVAIKDELGVSLPRINKMLDEVKEIYFET